MEKLVLVLNDTLLHKLSETINIKTESKIIFIIIHFVFFITNNILFNNALQVF